MATGTSSPAHRTATAPNGSADEAGQHRTSPARAGGRCWLIAPTIIAAGGRHRLPGHQRRRHVLPEGRRAWTRPPACSSPAASPASELHALAAASSARPRAAARSPARPAPWARSSGARSASPSSSPSSPWSLETVLGLLDGDDHGRTFRGRGCVRAAVLVPWAIPTAVTAKLWFFIFAFAGIANKLFTPTSCGPASEWPARFGGHHRRRLEDDAVHGAADPGRTADHPRRRLRGGARSTAPPPGSGSADHAAAGQAGADGRVLFRTLDVLRIYDLPAHPHRRGGERTPPRCPSWWSTRSGRASTAPRPCPPSPSSDHLPRRLHLRPVPRRECRPDRRPTSRRGK